MPGYHMLALPDAYRALTKLGARDLAWEWLRRDPDYRALWRHADAAARAASVRADAVVNRSRRPLVTIPQHPLARRWTHWGISFRRPARHKRARPAADGLVAGDRHCRADHRPADALGARNR